MELQILFTLLIAATTVNGQRTAPNIGGSCLLDIALVIDCSGSIKQYSPQGVDNWQFIINFLVNFVSSINVGVTETHVAAVSFGNAAYLQFYLSNFTNRGSLVNAVRRIPYCNENTNTTGGLRLTRTDIFKAVRGDRSDIPNVVVLITDGNPTRETDMLDEEAERIKNLGIRIVGVGVTNKINESIIRDIVTDREEDYIFATNFSVLVQHLDRLINRACRTETTTTSTPASLTPIYRPPHSGAACYVDMALVVDCSGSIRDTNSLNAKNVDNWQLIIDFLVDLVSSINVGEHETHVGAVSFGNDAYLHFYLSNYTDVQSLRNAIRSIRYCGGNTRTTGGLRRTRTEIFNTVNGDRSYVPNVIVLITDGNPTIEVQFLAAEARLIKKRNIRVVGVGVTNKVNDTIIQSVVTNKKTDYIFATDYNRLTTHLNSLINQTCQSSGFWTPPLPTPGLCPCTCKASVSSVAGVTSLLLLLLIVGFILSDLRQ